MKNLVNNIKDKVNTKVIEGINVVSDIYNDDRGEFNFSMLVLILMGVVLAVSLYMFISGTGIDISNNITSKLSFIN